MEPFELVVPEAEVFCDRYQILDALSSQLKPWIPLSNNRKCFISLLTSTAFKAP